MKSANEYPDDSRDSPPPLLPPRFVGNLDDCGALIWRLASRFFTVPYFSGGLTSGNEWLASAISCRPTSSRLASRQRHEVGLPSSH